MVKFTWVPALQAISTKILDFETKQHVLVEIAKECGVENGLTDKDENRASIGLEYIDPFTFISVLSKFGLDRRTLHFKKLIELWDIDVPKISDWNGFPSVNQQNAWLFSYSYERKERDIPLLWQLFKAVHDNTDISSIFDECLQIKQVGYASLTQALFRAFPDKHFPVDSHTWPVMEDLGFEDEESGVHYLNYLKKIKSISKAPFYKLSYNAWDHESFDDKIDTNSDRSEGELSVMPACGLNTILYGPPGTGKTYATVERAVDIILPEFRENTNMLSSKKKRRAYKDEYDKLVEGKQIGFVTFHQSFAYEDFVEGISPKTNESGQLQYEIKNGAFKRMAIEAKSNRRVQPTQTSPKIPETIWKMSLGNTLSDDSTIFDECIDNGYALLGYGGDLDFTGCNDRDAVWEKLKPRFESKKDADYDITSVNLLVNRMEVGDLVVVSDGNHKFRAIGKVTGDYFLLKNDDREGYRQCRPIEWLKVESPSLPREHIMDSAFSQMTLYQMSKRSINREKLATFLFEDELAIDNNTEKQFVLIIDEINRGNTSRIFGELITLLEPDKREGQLNAQPITLPYSRDNFTVPRNLYILATMNTADKSLTGLDIALRRRFEFVEMMPEASLLTNVEIEHINIRVMLEVINERIEVLLGRDYMIGHSYFIGLKSNLFLSFSDLPAVFTTKILPLLQEYFYDDWERISWVLNDHRKPKKERFLHLAREKTNSRSVEILFGSNIGRDRVRDKRWVVNVNALNNPKAYQGIYEIIESFEDESGA